MMDGLIKLVRKGFEGIKDHRRTDKGNVNFELADYISIAFAMFSLKDPSYSMFKQEYPSREKNLKLVYGIEYLPGDTAFREGLDGVLPYALQSQFKSPLEELEKAGVWEERKVLGDYLVVSFDGTGHYCSSKKDCPHCMVKNHKDGRKTYYHQLLGAVNVHPKQSTVFPIGCEPIVKQDGSKKNDCELNASKRLIPLVAQMLPEQKLIGVFDALYTNGPHIELLEKAKMSYVIGIKDGYVLVQVKALKRQNKLSKLEWVENDRLCTLNYTNSLVLNGQYPDTLVNYFDYSEVDAKTGKTLFYGAWITDIEITKDNAQDLVAIARSRWKIENETFNTLKNQGYHLEHNYGHGKQYLTSNFAILTMLAFLVDQIAQHLDSAFQKAWKARGTKKAFWKKVQQVFDLLPVASMNAIYRFIAGDIKIEFPLLE